MTTIQSKATAEFRFNGTGIWIFGGIGPDTGEYTVLWDGTSTTGTTGDIMSSQFLLFGAGSLSLGEHTVQIINSPSDTSSTNLVIDYITWEQSTGDADTLLTHYIDVSSVDNWSYTSEWSLAPSPNGTNGQALTTSTSNANATLTFRGSHIEVYGSISALYGGYMVSIDDGPASTPYQYFTADRYEQVLLYMADIQGQGTHTLKITSQELNGRGALAISRAVVINRMNFQNIEPVLFCVVELELIELGL
ncbi:hypothetical protein FRC17_007767 [Serendipita sp. 399]|nr:hypothetical protein FRC17_007767 [Serendipita sp. 399]